MDAKISLQRVGFVASGLSLCRSPQLPQTGASAAPYRDNPWFVAAIGSMHRPSLEARVRGKCPRAVRAFEQPLGEVDTEIRVDADQIGIEGGVVNFRGAIRLSRPAGPIAVRRPS